MLSHATLPSTGSCDAKVCECMMYVCCSLSLSLSLRTYIYIYMYTHMYTYTDMYVNIYIYIYIGSLGVMGAGLPFAIGAQVASRA